MAERIPWLTVREYCIHYNINRKTVRKWIAAGLVNIYHEGRVLRVQDRPPADTAADLEPPAEPPPLPPVSVGVHRRRARTSQSHIRVKQTVVPQMPGVYVIRQGTAAKVGCSRNLWFRLSALQTAYPSRIAIIGYATTDSEEAAYRLERELHRACRAYRVRGEWFRLTPDVIAALKPRMSDWDDNKLVESVQQS